MGSHCPNGKFENGGLDLSAHCSTWERQDRSRGNGHCKKTPEILCAGRPSPCRPPPVPVPPPSVPPHQLTPPCSLLTKPPPHLRRMPPPLPPNPKQDKNRNIREVHQLILGAAPGIGSEPHMNCVNPGPIFLGTAQNLNNENPSPQATRFRIKETHKEWMAA